VKTKGTAVIGSGIVNWAAAAVRATPSATAPVRIGNADENRPTEDSKSVRVATGAGTKGF
jgi:hypothetical protein